MTISNYTEGSGAFSFSALGDVYLIFLGGEYSPDNFPTNHATSKIIFVTIIFFNQSPWCVQNAFLYSISFFFLPYILTQALLIINFERSYMFTILKQKFHDALCPQCFSC